MSTLGDKWGFLRYPANQAFVASLYADSTKTKEYDEFIYNQVDYIMGATPSRRSSSDFAPAAPGRRISPITATST